MIGHPEHDLLFIATQVARAAGLKNPKDATLKRRMRDASGFHRLGDLLMVCPNHTLEPYKVLAIPRWKEMWFTTESATFEMLAQGHAPASQPFRDWVFKEVLPSIRKTGQYNVNESTTETGQQFAGE
ncbi:BRO-N domain-containing protein [Stutzerimonas sp. 381-2]